MAPSPQPAARRTPTPTPLERLARERLRAHPHFAGRQEAVQVGVEADRLVLTGRLPSFYLKQVLQAALIDLPGVVRIDNRVNVICCDGLSSEPRPAPTRTTNPST